MVPISGQGDSLILERERERETTVGLAFTGFSTPSSVHANETFSLRFIDAARNISDGRDYVSDRG